LLQPVPLGLADRLRRRHGLPPEAIERLYRLPGTARNAAGIAFAPQVHRALRQGFVDRHTQDEQKAVLRTILAIVEAPESRPRADPDSLAMLSWEWVREQIRVQLDPDDNQRLAELEKTEAFSTAVNSWADGFAPGNPEALPLAAQPRDPHAIQRLARFRGNPFGLPLLEVLAVGTFRWTLAGLLLFTTLGLGGLTVRDHLAARNGGCGQLRLEWAGPEDPDALLAIRAWDGMDSRPLYLGADLPALIRSTSVCRAPLRFELMRDGETATQVWKAEAPASALRLSLGRETRRLPCEQDLSDGAVHVMRCPSGGGTFSAPGRRSRIQGKQAGNRVGSVGIEESDSRLNTALVPLWNRLLDTGAVDEVRQTSFPEEIPDDFWPGGRTQYLLIHPADQTTSPVFPCTGCRGLYLGLTAAAPMAAIEALFGPGNDDRLSEAELIPQLRALGLDTGVRVDGDSAPLIFPSPQGQPGRLVVATDPPGLAFVVLDPKGKLVAKGKDGEPLTLEPGNYTQKAEMAGRGPVEQKASIRPDAETHVTLSLPQGGSPPPEGIEPDMVAIKGGCFLMGSPESEQGRFDNEHPHTVCVGDFHIAQTEVTQAQWEAVMGDNPSSFKKGGNYPVEKVSWLDVQKFIDKLNERTGRQYRLPTEAEWEYAARAGTETARYWGDGPDLACQYANVADQTAKKENPDWTVFECADGYVRTAPVGRFKANGFGLHDMLGNVWEWTCSEWDAQYGGAEAKCSSNKDANVRRVIRGGSWITNPRYLRSAYRGGNPAGYRGGDIGFRLAQD